MALYEVPGDGVYSGGLRTEKGSMGQDRLLSHAELGFAELFQGLEKDLVVYAFVVGEVAMVVLAKVQCR
jgi:hypothetical protein